MSRQRLLNLTFVLLLMILAMQKLASVTQQSDQVRATSVGLNGGYISQLSASLAPVTHALAQLWRRTQILAEWPIENNTTQWEKFYASTVVEKELIEARFHVENAEVYEWSIENPKKTIAELNRAERFLYDACPAINKTPLLATIERVAKELEIMEANTTGEGASQPANYEAVKTDLDHVINGVRTAGAKKVLPANSSQSS